MAKHQPLEINLNRAARQLSISFDDGACFVLSCEYLRVHSPSAEVQGHNPDQAVLQTGKREVNINTIEAVGNYAIKPVFDDGHDTGIYAWDTLYALGQAQEQNWQNYLNRLQAAGASREPEPAE